MRSVLLGCGLFLFALAIPARGELVVAHSLEWLACKADVIVVGHVTKVAKSRGPGDVRYEDCTVRVVETIRGKAAKEIVPDFVFGPPKK